MSGVIGEILPVARSTSKKDTIVSPGLMEVPCSRSAGVANEKKSNKLTGLRYGREYPVLVKVASPSPEIPTEPCMRVIWLVLHSVQFLPALAGRTCNRVKDKHGVVCSVVLLLPRPFFFLGEKILWFERAPSACPGSLSGIVNVTFAVTSILPRTSQSLSRDSLSRGRPSLNFITSVQNISLTPAISSVVSLKRP